METSISQQKIEWRKTMRERLQLESSESKHIAGLAVLEHLRSFIESFPQHLKLPGVAFFANLADEIDTSPLDNYLQENNLIRLLPTINDAHLLSFQRIAN